MTLSMYPVLHSLTRPLTNLIHILEKGVAHAESKGIDPTVLLNSRLYPDMYPLTRQVQIASDIVRRGAARLANVEAPAVADDEKTFDELIIRIRHTIAFLETLPQDQINGTEEKEISLPIGDRTLNFKGMPYLLHFILPNVYFHVTTAYDILRHCGVELGKIDYLGKP